MNRGRIIPFLLLAVCLVVSSCVGVKRNEKADVLHKAHRDGARIPVLTVQYPDMDMDAAYEVQRAYVKKRLAQDRIAGFKAGLTSAAGQKKFGVSAPLAGVLFASGVLEGAPVIPLSGYKKLMIETEIGFSVNEKISAPVKDVAELKNKVAVIMPVIELPDLGFADMKKLTGADIVAADVAAARIIVGDNTAAPGLDPNEVAVRLYQDGAEINTGKGPDAMGDQWQAALWLINTMVAQGYAIEPGHIIITGALGKMLPASPGKYLADYGEFGAIAFEIR